MPNLWRAPLAPCGPVEAPDGTTWEIRFHRPQTAPFEIRGGRSFPWTGSQAISLASLPEAASQRGTLVDRRQRDCHRPGEEQPPDSHPGRNGALRPLRHGTRDLSIRSSSRRNGGAVVLSRSQEASPSLPAWVLGMPAGIAVRIRGSRPAPGRLRRGEHWCGRASGLRYPRE